MDFTMCKKQYSKYLPHHDYIMHDYCINYFIFSYSEYSFKFQFGIYRRGAVERRSMQWERNEQLRKKTESNKYHLWICGLIGDQHQTRFNGKNLKISQQDRYNLYD